MNYNFYQIDKKQAQKKWGSVVEALGLDTNSELGKDKLEWISEMAEYHDMREKSSQAVNENVAYANMQSFQGMGGVVSPQPGSTPGNLGTTGSGDLGQNLLPIAMKIAYQTIGLDLVGVKPSAGPKIDLLYMDFRYDDSPLTGDTEKPQAFQVPVYEAMRQHLQRLIDENQNPSERIFVAAEVANNAPTTVHNPMQEGGMNGVKSAYDAADVDTPTDATTLSDFQSTDGNIFYLEFLGFSIYTGNAIFRAYRQLNTPSSGASASSAWDFDYTKNSFPAKMAIANAIGAYIGPSSSDHRITWLRPSFNGPSPSGSNAGTTAIPFIENATSLPEGNYREDVSNVSALEDHIEGFSANWNKTAPMSRAEDDYFNPGVIGTHFFTKTVQTGVVEVSAAVKRNEIEDIKATTGVDIVQKLEAVLVNELSQTISKHIVNKVKDLGVRNRATAPKVNRAGGASALPSRWDSFETLFDFDVDKYLNPGAFNNMNTNNFSNYRESFEGIQRKLVTKINNASSFILKEGRYGPASYLVTSATVASALTDIAGYTQSPYKSSVDAKEQLYPAGTLGNITVYVDPYQDYADNSVYLGRKNPVDQPGMVFIPYLMAQQLSLISEATRAPRLFLRSRYAVTEIGFYPEKQFMALYVRDSNNILV